MNTESRARVLRLVNQIWQAARQPKPDALELERMKEYGLRIVESVVVEEAARRAEGNGGA